MLYLELSWCWRQLANDAHHERLITSQPVIRDAGLFARYLQIVALMTQQNTAALPASVARFLRDLPLRPLAPVALSPTSARLFSRLATNLQAPPTLDSLADEFALRKETLIRAFKQDTGLTPASFINIARIEFAKTRLRAGIISPMWATRPGLPTRATFIKPLSAIPPPRRASMRSPDQ